MASGNTGKEQLILRGAHLPCNQRLHCDRHRSKRPTFSDRNGYGRKSLGHVAGWAGAPQASETPSQRECFLCSKKGQKPATEGLWGSACLWEGGGQERPRARARPASPKVCRPDNCGLFANKPLRSHHSAEGKQLSFGSWPPSFVYFPSVFVPVKPSRELRLWTHIRPGQSPLPILTGGLEQSCPWLQKALLYQPSSEDQRSRGSPEGLHP